MTVTVAIYATVQDQVVPLLQNTSIALLCPYSCGTPVLGILLLNLIREGNLQAALQAALGVVEK